MSLSRNYKCRQSPAAFPGVMGVAAVDNNDVQTSFSNFGSYISVSAPGDIYENYSTQRYNQYNYFAGTSCSAPMVSGAAGLIISEALDNGINLTNDEVRHLLEASAEDLGDDGWDQIYGYGRIDAERALKYLNSPYIASSITSTGGNKQLINDTHKHWFYNNGGGVSTGQYFVKTYKVTKTVNFPILYLESPIILIRERSTVGWSGLSPNKELPWAETTSITESGVTFSTFIYYFVADINGHPIEEWYPCEESEVEFAYTVLGIKAPTTSGELSEDETWNDSISLTGNVIVPNGIILTIISNTSVDLNGFYLKSTGTGEIILGSNVTFNPDINVKNGSNMLGQFAYLNQATAQYSSVGDVINVMAGTQYMNDNATVHSNVKLKIYPGVELRSSSGKGIYINGELESVGLSVSPIIFTSSGTSWMGIKFNPISNDNSEINYCEINNAFIGLNLDNASPSILNSHIYDCSLYGLYINAISYPDISGLELTGNGIWGAVVNEDASFTTDYVLIDGNGIDGVLEKYGGICNVGESTVRYSQISYNDGVGIYISEDGWADLGQDAEDGYGNNNIGFNEIYDIESDAAESILAIMNYWGDDGPDENKLEGDIEYEPYYEQDIYLPWDFAKPVVTQAKTEDYYLYLNGKKDFVEKRYSSSKNIFNTLISKYPGSYFSKLAIPKIIQIEILNGAKTNVVNYLLDLLDRDIPQSLTNTINRNIINVYRKLGMSNEALSLINSIKENNLSQKDLIAQEIYIYFYDLLDTTSALNSLSSLLYKYSDEFSVTIIKDEFTNLLEMDIRIHPVKCIFS